MDVRPTVIVVADADAWVQRAIGAVMSSDSVEVVGCSTARDALDACSALAADCLLTDVGIPEQGGLWLAARLREQPSNVALIPIVMTSIEPGDAVRLAALGGGADVFIPKPLRIVELVAQVRALVAMAARLRQVERPSVLPPASAERRAIYGDLTRMTIATVISALEIERRSGDLILLGEGNHRLSLEMASGLVVGGRAVRASGHVAPLSSIEALQEALDWTGSRFEFVPGAHRPAPRGAEPFGKLMFRAMRGDEGRISLVSISGAEPGHAAKPPPPPAPRPAPPASSRSGTRSRIPASPSVSAPRPSGLGSRLIESVAARTKNDPRAEPVDPSPSSPSPKPLARPSVTPPGKVAKR